MDISPEKKTDLSLGIKRGKLLSYVKYNDQVYYKVLLEDSETFIYALSLTPLNYEAFPLSKTTTKEHIVEGEYYVYLIQVDNTFNWCIIGVENSDYERNSVKIKLEENKYIKINPQEILLKFINTELKINEEWAFLNNKKLCVEPCKKNENESEDSNEDNNGDNEGDNDENNNTIIEKCSSQFFKTNLFTIKTLVEPTVIENQPYNTYNPKYGCLKLIYFGNWEIFPAETVSQFFLGPINYLYEEGERVFLSPVATNLFFDRALCGLPSFLQVESSSTYNPPSIPGETSTEKAENFYQYILEYTLEENKFTELSPLKCYKHGNTTIYSLIKDPNFDENFYSNLVNDYKLYYPIGVYKEPPAADLIINNNTIINLEVVDLDDINKEQIIFEGRMTFAKPSNEGLVETRGYGINTFMEITEYLTPGMNSIQLRISGNSISVYYISSDSYMGKKEFVLSENPIKTCFINSYGFYTSEIIYTNMPVFIGVANADYILHNTKQGLIHYGIYFATSV